MATATYLPDGTATGNADAVRAAPIAQAFTLFANLMQGVDSEPRMDPGMTGNAQGLLGPTQSFGVDIGIDANGDPYVRGRSSGLQDSRATPADQQPNAANMGGQTSGIPPLVVWAVLGFIAYKVLK